MPIKPATSKASKSRDYDKESGKNRLEKKKGRKPAPLPESDSESEVSASDSEVESDYEIAAKDVHRRQPAPARPRKVKAQQDTSNDKVGEEPKEDEKKIAPAFNFLVALAYRQGTSAVQYDSRSFYVPDCYSLFSTAYFICDLLAHNSLVHEFDPGFTSLTFYLYVGHLFYYHILRIRDAAGELTREQRRCLRHYEQVGPAETWPVPTPMIGILESYGSVQPPSKYYGKIVPNLPSFTGFTAEQSLTGLSSVRSSLRTPCIPAMQKFLYNFGTRRAQFYNGILYPTADPRLAAGATGNVFLGLDDSSATGSAQYLFFNSAWNTPTETAEELTSYPHALKRQLVSRFDVPDLGNTETITGLETYLGFRDTISKSWMKNLNRSASTVTRFFPGSVNLSTIGTLTQEEMATPITWTTVTPRTATANKWYRGRTEWTYSFNGRVNTEQSGFLYQAAASAAPNSIFAANIYPARFPQAMHDPQQSGPYYISPANCHSVPLTLIETVGQPDPIRNMLTFMDEQLYDNLGGRARRA